MATAHTIEGLRRDIVVLIRKDTFKATATRGLTVEATSDKKNQHVRENDKQ